MAITSAQVTVSTTATLLAQAGPSGATVLIAIASGGSPITLGPAAVEAGAGFTLAAGQTVSLPLGPHDALYGRVASSTQAASVLVANR